MKNGIKHFFFVGVGFALIGGWIFTVIVNTVLGNLLQMILSAPPTKFYLGSLFLTVVSISLIGSCEIIGNRLFRRRLAPTGLRFSSILISMLLFTVLVIGFVSPELSQVLTQYANNTHYFYHHGSEMLMILSLPVARLVLLPGLYFVIARWTLR